MANLNLAGIITRVVTDLRTRFAAISHTHAAGDVTSGTLGVARGGTGKSSHTANSVLTGSGTSAVGNVATASGALYATSANGAPSFGTLPVAQGGTGATSAAAARTGLDAAQSNGASNTLYSAEQAISANASAISALQDSVNSIGSVSYKPWVASSSTSYNVQLIETMLLAKGTYLLIVHVPYIVSGSTIANIGQMTDRIINMTRSYDISILTLVLNNPDYITVRSVASTQVTFGYLERGGMYAIRLK